MSKLSEIVFKPVQSKEFEVMGKKVVLKSLTTKDTIELNIEVKEGFTSTQLLSFALTLLSRAVVSVDGVVPESPADVIKFLEAQDSSVVFAILGKYQELTQIDVEEIKN